MLKQRVITAIFLLAGFLGAVFYLPPGGWAGVATLVAALAVLALAALPYRLGLVLAIVLGLLAGAAVARRGEARR